MILRLEDAPAYAFDMTRMGGPELLRCQLASALVALSATDGGRRRTSSVKNARTAMSSWLRWVDVVNVDQPGSRIEGMADVTPFHLVRYRDFLSTHVTASTGAGYQRAICTLLRHAPDLPEMTRREARKRKGNVAPVSRIERYSNAEFTRIRAAARRTAEAAHARIHVAHLEALSHAAQAAADPVRARALYEVLTHGQPLDLAGFEALGAWNDRGERLLIKARRFLFLSPDEAYAAAVLLACHRGLNLSPVVTAQIPVVHEGGILQLDLDKPRRGHARFWPEILDDNGEDDDRAAAMVRMIAEATEPARAYLAAHGAPTNRLLIRWSEFRNRPLVGLPCHQTRVNSAWAPSGITVNFVRLRRSVPGRGVSKEPTDHDPRTYLHYVRTDPIAVAEQQSEAAAGVQAAMDRARNEVHAKLRKDQDADPDHDALIVTCNDPQRHPITRRPCTTAFFSFLDCLDCSNAATVGRLLPRQMAAISVLEDLRDAIGEEWERRFARFYYMLVAIIERHTPTERTNAAALATNHVPIILAALRHEVPT